MRREEGRSPINMLRSKVLGDGNLPFVAVGQQLFLVVHELLVGFSGEFIVWTLDNRVHLKHEEDDGMIKINMHNLALE